MNLSSYPTPSLVLDREKLKRNIHRVRAAVARHPGVSLRPHLKTVKSIDVADKIFGAGPKRATVSTLQEAEYFVGHGVRDLLYAVAIAPDKLDRVGRLLESGAQVTVVVDDLTVAKHAIAWAARASLRPGIAIEVDSDGHRSGVDPDGDVLVELGWVLTESNTVRFSGVMTHAGGSYDCNSREEIVRIAEQERSAAVRAAERLRSAGIDCADVSVGSTPTVMMAEHLTGVTESRVGVAFLNDLTMVGLGVCGVDDIAVSILASVIGHRQAHNQLIIDAGWTSLSADKGRASQFIFDGFGVATDLRGRLLPDLGVVATNQEHGIIGSATGSPIHFDWFPIGTRLRILPNHACATAANFSEFRVLDVAGRISATWRRCSGW